MPWQFPEAADAAANPAPGFGNGSPELSSYGSNTDFNALYRASAQAGTRQIGVPPEDRTGSGASTSAAGSRPDHLDFVSVAPSELPAPSGQRLIVRRIVRARPPIVPDSSSRPRNRNSRSMASVDFEHGFQQPGYRASAREQHTQDQSASFQGQSSYGTTPQVRQWQRSNVTSQQVHLWQRSNSTSQQVRQWQRSNATDERTVRNVGALVTTMIHEAFVERLPTHVVEGKLPEVARVCVVCTDDFRNGDERTILPCLHGFHSACCLEWLKKHGTCPVCRHPIRSYKLKQSTVSPTTRRLNGGRRR